ncbi:MAG: hypothetical protein ACKKL6_02275 [Candidatus Komeilibacteria bacterium]
MTSFKKLLKENHLWYKKIGKVYCPILNERIIFNSKGFYHLRYKSSGGARSINEQMYKIGLLPLVIPVIKRATYIHEYKKKRYSKAINKYFEIWELRAKVGKQKSEIAVVLRRVGNGNITFFSVWKN